MRTILFFILVLLPGLNAGAQKIERIEFNLYTDSLKKGFYNYINVDGLLSNGSWMPLDSTDLVFKANTGHFKGNDLFIDSSYKSDKVTVTVSLRRNPNVSREIVIYIRKRPFTEPLKTDEEVLGKPAKKGRLSPSGSL